MIGVDFERRFKVEERIIVFLRFCSFRFFSVEGYVEKRYLILSNIFLFIHQTNYFIYLFIVGNNF